MNVWKKVSMLTLVVALAMSFCVMAGAAASPIVVGNDSKGLTGDDLTSISFAVTLKNATDNTNPRPGVTYSYTVTKDAGGPTVAISGESTVTFTYSSNGADANGSVTLAISDASNVTSGTYTYTVEQAALAAGYGDLGFTVAAKSYTLQLSVNAGKVTQAILKNGETKVAGFDNEYNPSATPIGADIYVDKIVFGPAANAATDTLIPFSVTITPPSVGDWSGLSFTLASADNQEYVFNNGAGSATLGSAASTLTGNITADVNTSATAPSDITGNAAHALKISGLPKGTTVKVQETVAETDGYKIYSYNEGNEVLDGTATTDTNGTTATVSASDIRIKYLNFRDTISNTGVTLRYAPYLLTLGAGITVLPLSRRYKKREEDV